MAYLEKQDFWRRLVSKFWGHHCIRGIETSPYEVSISYFESLLVLHAKRDNSQIDNLLIVSKNMIMSKRLQT